MKKTTFLVGIAAVALTLTSCCPKCKKADTNQQTATEQTTDSATEKATEQAANNAGYIDFELPGADGKMLRLSDIVSKNKMTMVDFWASWCGPCRAEMPHVVKAYKDFHSKGLEIVGVSLDERKDDWLNAVKELNMNWPQMSDLKGWNSKAAQLYHIQGIPASVLINQNGEIVGQDLRGEDLHNRLAELLK